MLNTGQIPDQQEIAHQLAIYDVLTAHSRGVDRADRDVLESAYWPDAEVAYGSYDGPAHPFCARLVESIKVYKATQHSVSNVNIERQANNAVVESYVTAYHYTANSEDISDTEMTYIGRYLDHMQCRRNTWKILFRQVIMEWNQNMATSAILDKMPFAGLAKGARKPDDPLYAMRRKVFQEQ